MSMGIGNGRKIVTTAATAEALIATTTPFTKLTITAETDNTGIIVVGSSTVIASLSTRSGTPLYAGDSYTIETKGIDPGDMSKIYIDATVSGDGVTMSHVYEDRIRS